MYLYSTLFVLPHTQGAQAWITQSYLQLHQCLPLPHKRSPDGASPDWGCGHQIAAYTTHLSTPKEWKAELAWLADLQQTVYPHISGHPSAAGRVQDREVHRSKTNVPPQHHATREGRNRKGIRRKIYLGVHGWAESHSRLCGCCRPASGHIIYIERCAWKGAIDQGPRQIQN